MSETPKAALVPGNTSRFVGCAVMIGGSITVNVAVELVTLRFALLTTTE